MGESFLVLKQCGHLDPGSVVSFSDTDRAAGVDVTRLLGLGAIRAADPDDGEPAPYQMPALPVGPDGAPYANVPHVTSEWEQAVLARKDSEPTEDQQADQPEAIPEKPKRARRPKSTATKG